MTALEWLAWLVLLVVALAAGLAVTLSNGAVTRAIRQLERTYRRQKSLELEKLEEELVARRMQEVEAELARPDGWRKVLNQVLADALVLSEVEGLPDITARIDKADPLEVSAAPVPRFTVLGVNGMGYTFTTSPEALERQFGRRLRAVQVVALDASLHPATRAEVQAVWEHLAAQRLPGDCPYSGVLPRQAEWFLMVREPESTKGSR